jgi:hypothetical protein
MKVRSANRTASMPDAIGVSIRSAFEPVRASRYFRLCALVAASTFAATSIAGCASAAPYNPSGLDGAQLSRASDICQGIMGLSPHDPPRPVYGAADNPDLTDGENYYQGCVASLSAATGRGDFAQAQIQADADCHAKGYQSGSPELAQCVLNGERNQRVSGASYAAFRPAPRSGRSYYDAGPSERHRMVEQACAQLGLNPVGGAFDNCVKDMTDTFFSIDNPRG